MNIKSSYKREKMQNENNDKKKPTMQQGYIIDTMALKRSALPKSSIDFDVR